MTNECLCTAIQEGHDELLPELWKQIQRFVESRARQFARNNYLPPFIDADDLVQSGFLATLAALKSFKEGQGTFLCWLDYYLMRAFRKEAGGIHPKQTEAERNAANLDEPIQTDDGQITLADLIPDESVNVELEGMADYFNDQLRQLLLNYIETELTEKNAELLIQSRLKGKSNSELAQEYSMHPASVSKQNSISIAKLRNHADKTYNGRALKEAAEAEGILAFYRPVGRKEFSRTRMSEEEAALLKYENYCNR